MLWLRTPWGRRSLGAAWDPETLIDQLGTSSMGKYRENFTKQDDLRPHPLISPKHINCERLSRGLPPIRSADDLFRHLLYPDLLPLNTHPWFDCRDYQIQTGELGVKKKHPILSYLNEGDNKDTDNYNKIEYKVPWLIALGAHLDRHNENNLPEVISRLHPGLILAKPQDTLGNPSDGEQQLIANEKYLKEIQVLCDSWPDIDRKEPLNWLTQQPYIDEIGVTEIPPATGYQLWWITGHWEAQVLANIAGIDAKKSREFGTPQDLFNEIQSTKQITRKGDEPILIALTEPLNELFIANNFKLPHNIGILNLLWPRPSQQSSWLHMLASARIIVECRAEVRAFFQGIGLKAEWPKIKKPHKRLHRTNSHILLLAIENSAAEDQLAAAAPTLNADRYDAILRLDAHLQLVNPLIWLNEHYHSHDNWIWLNPLHLLMIQGYALVSWARKNGVNIQILCEEPEKQWWRMLTK